MIPGLGRSSGEGISYPLQYSWASQEALVVREPSCQCRRLKRRGFDPCVGKIPWRRAWQPTPVFLPREFHGQRSLAGYSPWGRKESDKTEQLHFHFSLSCIGEGNGNPLQCSCLENPRDGEAWWAAVYGVAQSRTQQQQNVHSSHFRLAAL